MAANEVLAVNKSAGSSIFLTVALWRGTANRQKSPEGSGSQVVILAPTEALGGPQSNHYLLTTIADEFTFTGAAGQRLHFDGLGTDFNIDVQLFSPSGRSIFNTDTSRDPGDTETAKEIQVLTLMCVYQAILRSPWVVYGKVC